MNNKLLNVRIPEKLLNDYRDFCEENTFTMSKRIRKLMEADIEKWKKYQAGKLLK
jgi:antitoxin component of RelBE/YafQ-DinJ toxin-antitoxin module